MILLLAILFCLSVSAQPLPVPATNHIVFHTNGVPSTNSPYMTLEFTSAASCSSGHLATCLLHSTNGLDGPWRPILWVPNHGITVRFEVAKKNANEFFRITNAPVFYFP